jgi:uncharacterized protein (TIGR03435 family)
MALKTIGTILCAWTLAAWIAAAADVSGKWGGAAVFLVLKQDGEKVTGTAGPSESQQLVQLSDGKIDGDRLMARVGTMKLDLHVNGDEMRGEVTESGSPMVVVLRRITGASTGPKRFEVASMKRATPDPQKMSSSMRLDPGRLTCTNASLLQLITRAYDVKDYQVSGPDWLRSEYYNITANVPAGALQDDVIGMLRSLLVERLHLSIHRESKEMPVYALVISKEGSKLKEVEFGRSSMNFNGKRIEARSVQIGNLTKILSDRMGRPVIDQTGLKGYYDFTLEFAADEPAAAPSGDRPAEVADPGANLLTALREQLGLRLEPRRAPVELLVLDRVEKIPAEN